MDYIRVPEAIYERSFAIIREEVDLDAVPQSLRPVAVRLMHACGMTDLIDDLRYDEHVADAVVDALARGTTVFADCEMAASAIIARALPDGVSVRCTLNAPQVPELAKARGTTRSAAAVSLWERELDGAICVIGNAPTALFALLEALDRGAPEPAAILAFPVGFVGAAESKHELAANPRGVPYLTLLGRRGGSAMAGAALNAFTCGAGT